MGGRVRIDPNLYGHLSPAQLRHWLRYGFRATRVGAAVLLRGPHGERWIVGCWDGAPPAWAERLHARHRWLIGRGPAPAVEQRRESVWLARRRRLRLRAPNGRWLPGPIPWWADVDDAGRILTPRERQPWRLA